MATKIGSGPKQVGDILVVYADHTGPSSYTQVSPGATPTGGDSVTAQELGLKFIEGIVSSGDDTGSYLPVPLALVNPSTSAIIRWQLQNSNSEAGSAVNLSARHARLIAWGR